MISRHFLLSGNHLNNVGKAAVSRAFSCFIGALWIRNRNSAKLERNEKRVGLFSVCCRADLFNAMHRSKISHRWCKTMSAKAHGSGGIFRDAFIKGLMHSINGNTAKPVAVRSQKKKTKKSTTGPMRCLKKQLMVELFSFSQKSFESAPYQSHPSVLSLRQIFTDTACGKVKKIDGEERQHIFHGDY